MKKKNNNYILLIIIAVILICVLGLWYISDNKDNEDNKSINYSIVNDYSDFFTVNSCIYRYIQYLSSKDTDKLLKVLNQEFIDNNNVTKDNIYSILTELDGEYSFSSKKMYVGTIKDKYYVYYVYGVLLKEEIEGIDSKVDKYFKVYYDKSENVFSIYPIDINDFNEVDNG